MITLRLDKNGGINKGDIKAFEHDNLSEVYIIQLYKNGAIYDLTNKSIELTMVERKRKIGDMVSLPIYNATEGKVKLEVVSDITKQDGIYDFKLTVKDTTGLIETFPSFQVKIENDITDHITGEIVQDKNFTILTEGLKALADYNIYKTNALKVPEIEQDIVEINEQLDNKANKNITKNNLTLTKDINDLNFNIVSVSRQVNLMSKFKYFEDNCDGEYALYDDIKLGATDANPTISTKNGVTTFESANWCTYARKTKKANDIPYVFMELGIESFGTQTTGTQSVGVGLIKDLSNYLAVIYDSVAKQLKVDIQLSGTPVSRCVTDIELTAPCKIGFCQNETSISMFVDEGSGWRYINHAGSYKNVLDLRNPISMKGWYHGYIFFTNKANTMKINSFKSGAFGQVGVRDHNVVRYTDGTPVIINNELYISATSAGVRNSIPGSHYSIFAMDLSSYEVRETAKLLFKRNGLVLGDHAGNVVFDKEENCYHIFVSNWGDWENVGPAQVVYAKCYDDVLNGIKIIDETTMLNIPVTLTEGSAYDPDVIKIDGEWHIYYTESSKSADISSFSGYAKGKTLDSLVKVADDKVAQSGSYEGCKVQKIGGEWFVFSSNLTEYRCCNGKDMSFVCNVNAPKIGNNSAKPHFTIVPVPCGNKTKLIVVSFDNTQYSNIGIHTRGNWFVFENDRLLDGYEFQTIKIPNLC